MRYTFLDHTADIKFQAFGDDVEEAFSSAFHALNETIYGKIKVSALDSRKIQANGSDWNSLLYNFLEEILFLLDSEGFLCAKIKAVHIDKKKFSIRAEAIGDKASKYEFSNSVKAVTYNDMFVRFNEDKKEWEIQVVLDV